MGAGGALRSVAPSYSMLPRTRDETRSPARRSHSPSQRLIPVAQLVASAEAVRPSPSAPPVHPPLWGPSPSPPERVPTTREPSPVPAAPAYDRDIKRYAKLLTPFIYKLYSLVSDPSTNSLCEWTNAGNSFVVHDPVSFSANVLPLYFKHNQFSSFVRQLNKYSFHKLAPGAFIFGHPNFLQRRPDLLLRIGPPRPQDRPAADKHRHASAPAGGASLSSLQRPNHLPDRPDIAVSDSVAVARGRPRGHRPEIGPVSTLDRYSEPGPSSSSRYPGVAPEIVEGRVPGLDPGPASAQFGRRYLGGAGEAHLPVTGATEGAIATDRVDPTFVEGIVGRLLERHSEEMLRSQMVAKNERDELLRRLTAVERRNGELWQRYESVVHELRDAQSRIQVLERAERDQTRKRQLIGSTEGSGSLKRLRDDHGKDEQV